MINVLHLRNTDRVCGPGKTIIETACAADPAAFHLSVGLFCAQGRTNAYLDAVRARGIEVHPMEAAHAWDPRLLGRLASLIRERNIHIVHAHDYLSDILTRAVNWRVPVATMSTVHGWITNTARSRMYVKVSQLALRGLDRVVAVSEQTRVRVLAAGVSADRVTVIHNAIVASNYRAADFDRGAFRRRAGISPDAVVIGNIGRLSPEKGQREFLQAAAPLARQDARVHLVVAGSGPDEASLKTLAVELGIQDRVTFTGHLKEVRPVYRDLDILALTSFTEGFPNVILEAFCMDVPVLATDVGGVREIITDGETGVLVRAGCTDEIEAGLRHLVSERADGERMAAAGKQLVMERFEFAQRTVKEEAVYRELMDGR
jgi:glycosyltransferase involved in cell wall biosynthesis